MLAFADGIAQVFLLLALSLAFLALFLSPVDGILVNLGSHPRCHPSDLIIGYQPLLAALHHRCVILASAGVVVDRVFASRAARALIRREELSDAPS